MNHCALRAARRATLLGCASSLVLAAAVLPSHAEQQVINFMVNGGGFYDVTGAVPASTGGTGCCYSYVGPAQSGTPGHLSTPTNNHHAITFATTSSGNGAISEAKNVAHIGTQGHAVAGQVADDAYDGFGGVGLLGQNNFGGLTVTRNTEVTHGPTNGVTTPITNAFTNAGVPNAARFVETITNTTGSTINGTFAFFNNLGSDNNTAYVATNNGPLTLGSPHSATGNLWVTSVQNSTTGPDPVLTTVVGNNKYTNTQVKITTLNYTSPYANGDDNPVYQFPISVAPGKTVTIVLFSVLTANINFNPAAGPNPIAAQASDIVLGGQLANLIDNNGKPIPLNSPFFVGLTPAQMATIINFDFNFITTLMPMGANINQMNVANGINNFINAGGNTTPLLGLLMLPTNQLNDALSHLSGEAAVDASKGAFSIMNEFLDLMLDPFVDGRTAGMGGGMTQFAAEPAPGFPSDVALAYTSVLKAPPAMTLKAPDLGQRWIAWSSGFGAYNKTNGDPVVGSNDVGAHDYGFVGGVDYRLTRNTSVGVALAGGGTTWSLSQAIAHDIGAFAVQQIRRRVCLGLAYLFRHCHDALYVVSGAGRSPVARCRELTDQAASPQSMTLATHTASASSNRTRYGVQPPSRRARATS